MNSRFEQIIGEIEDFIDSCKYQPLSSTKIIVDKERLDDLLKELRTKTPDEVKRYQKIISNKEAIMNDAREKANSIISEAQAQTDHMLSEHEIMQQAYAKATEVVNNAQAQAQRIVDDATTEANSVRQAAMQYTDDSLANLQNILAHSIDTAQAKYGSLVEQLRECEGIVNRDRAALYPQVSLEADIASLSDDGSPNVKIGSENSAKGNEGKLDIL